MKKISNQTGFTLLELIVTMVMAAILASIAIPSFQAYTARTAVSAEQRSFLADVSYARSVAISRSRFVVVCGISADYSQCDDGGSWRNGWVVFVDDGAADDSGTAQDGVLNGNEEIIRIHQATTEGWGAESTGVDERNLINVFDTDNAAIDTFGFNTRGYLNIANTRLTVRVCDVDRNNHYARGVLIDLTGRALSSYDLNSSGIHEDVNGDDFAC